MCTKGSTLAIATRPIGTSSPSVASDRQRSPAVDPPAIAFLRVPSCDSWPAIACGRLLWRSLVVAIAATPSLLPKWPRRFLRPPATNLRPPVRPSPAIACDACSAAPAATAKRQRFWISDMPSANAICHLRSILSQSLKSDQHAS